TTLSLFLRGELFAWIRLLSFSVYHCRLLAGGTRLRRLDGGNALVPFSLVLAVTGVMSGRLTKRFRLASLLTASCFSMGLGLAILSFVPASYGYNGMVFPFLLVAAGAGPGFTLLNTAGLAAVPAQRSGQATGMIYMFRFGGGAIGVAAASALHGALFQRHLIPRLSKVSLSFAQQKL